MFPKKLNSYLEIAESYDLFIFDVCGVVHNGITLYPQTIKFIEHLRLLNKQIVFISNSPRPSTNSIKYLAQQGFVLSNSEKFISSGDYFKYCYQNNIDNMFTHKNNFYDIGNSYGVDLLADLNISNLPNFINVDYVIISAFTEDTSSLNKWDDELKEAANNRLIALCVNPDIIAPHGDKIRYTPGTFAEKYKVLGGEVHYYGKPHIGIYRYALDSILTKFKISKNKVIAIGDSLGTDIKGARTYGIDSLLLLNGVHAGNGSSDAALQELFLKFGSIPNFIMQSPKFD
jgi:HAD superfamily hydrolase (TIGR01459 family)